MEYVKAKELPRNPRESANILSSIFYCWVLPLLFKGRKRELVQEDLYQPLDTHKSSIIGKRLTDAWQRQLNQHSAGGRKPSLLRAMIKVFGLQMAWHSIALLANGLLLNVPQPLFIGGLVSHYTTPGSDINIAYIYAAAIIVSSALNVLTLHPQTQSTLHCGMKLRVATCSMIYRKSLKLSKTALGDTTAGQVVNLLSNDVSRLDLSNIYLHYLLLGPVQTVVITYLMYREIGVSAIIGVVCLLVFVPLQFWLGKQTSVLRLRTALMTDERVRMMNEIIQGIQVIKMYAWEKPFGRMVELARKKEIRVIRHTSYVRGIIFSFVLFTTRLSIFASLVAYALLGNLVTAETAFVVTAYYTVLRLTMTVLFPLGITQLAESIVSIRRIEKFMMYDEKKQQMPLEEYMASVDGVALNGGNSKANGKTANGIDDAPVQLTNVRARWEPQNADYTLNDVSLRVQPQTLVAVIGPVGSGKSSLLQAILRELPIESGSIQVNGGVSYASQEPWLFSGSVRTNILFGQPMNRDRYREVVKRCALERDFALLPNGDKTIVGDRGQSLSGGQKARISLARACYRKAAIYLLDDPLSAVDTHVGKHLFDQCLGGFLKSKIVILVTHQLQYLQNVDQIVIFKHGKVEAVGSYDSLRVSGLDFAKLLTDPSKEGGEQSEEESVSRRSSRSSNHIKRQNSVTSKESVEETKNNPMQVSEKRSEVVIGLSLYKKYFKAGGGYLYMVIMVAFCLAAQLLASGSDFFLTYWVTKEEERQHVLGDTETTEEYAINKLIRFLGIRDGLMDDRLFDVYVFAGITILTIIITLSRSFIFFNLAMRASIKLHNRMYAGITQATMYFFNTNPSGRILNRFSKDMGQVDEILPPVMMDVIQIFLQMAGIVVVVAIVNYWLIIPTVIIGMIFWIMRNFYLKSSRVIKHMEATTRSPIYSHLGATMAGLSTIRAFGAEEVLIEEFDKLQDTNSSAFYMFLCASRTFGFWLDSFCVVYITVVTLSFFLMGTAGGNVGLAITQAMGLTNMVQWGMRQSAEMENTMTAVERVVEYESVDREDALEASTPEKKPPTEWPTEGAVKFDRVSLRYFPDPNADVVLKELDFEIAPRDKVGIVGRTGAGKSSLINALFRLSYNDGAIIIDDRDTQSMGLHDLRKKISIIPQEPVLFSGTMRYNLDPFDEYSDEKVWSALEQVKLKEAMDELPHGLQSRITEGGGNFSVGQRQLVCLARAILRENRVLVMDEATANVDPQTDALIQATIRDQFGNCTILTIAHRLNTVIDCDKVLVMDAGRVVEYGSPYQLLTEEKGPRVFYGMLQEMGQTTFDSLMAVAKQAEKDRKAKLLG